MQGKWEGRYAKFWIIFSLLLYSNSTSHLKDPCQICQNRSSQRHFSIGCNCEYRFVGWQSSRQILPLLFRDFMTSSKLLPPLRTHLIEVNQAENVWGYVKAPGTAAGPSTEQPQLATEDVVTEAPSLRVFKSKDLSHWMNWQFWS